MQYNIKMILYHNKNCSKSRKCLEILSSKNLDFQIREYMKDKLTLNEITHLLKNLNSDLNEIVRDKKLLGIESINDVKKLSLHLYENPNNMQRPIFFNGNSYTICRPPESINQLI